MNSTGIVIGKQEDRKIVKYVECMHGVRNYHPIIIMIYKSDVCMQWWEREPSDERGWSIPSKERERERGGREREREKERGRVDCGQCM